MKKLSVSIIPLLILLNIASASVAQDAQASNFDIDRIRRATVFVTQATSDSLITQCVGTGTIIRYDGLILTNAHNTVPSESCPGDELIISMALNPNEPPIPKYRAEIAQADVGIDLALLRITRELDGRLIEPGSLPILPFVDLADSSQLQLDQTITTVGYPRLDSNSVGTVTGTITGFIAEPSGDDRSWIKTTNVDPIPGTMSGGGTYNQNGELLGVPTTAPIRVRGESGNCRLLEDTNNDGFINSNDTCVPIGDFINVLRPVSFARPLLRSASLQLDVESLTTSNFQINPDEAPTVNRDRVFFALSVNNDLPARVIDSAPSGTTSLYLFFDYRNFTPQTVYELRVSIDGVPNPAFSLPPVRWSGSTNGIWYVGSSGQTWPNGVYEFRLFVNGLAAASKTITVGGTAQQKPTFSDVAFGLLDADGNLRGESYVLPAGNIAQARFVYRNMQPDLQWASVWYYNGAPIPNGTQQARWGDASLENITEGSRTISIQPEGGLVPGNYRLELYIQQPGSSDLTLSAMGEFVVAGSAEGVLPAVFSTPDFIRVENPLQSPTADPANTFPDGAPAVYAQFDWQQIATGTLWTIQWEVDGVIFFEQTRPWSAPLQGAEYTLRFTSPNGIPDGNYTLNLLINGILLESSSFTVGIGQLAIDRLSQIGGIQLQGQIVDGITEQGLEGATFILISEDYSIADFTWQQEQIYAIAITDRNGNFEIDRPVQLDTPYSVYIISEGYLPITRDAFTIDQEILSNAGGSPIEMYIPLTRN